MVRPVLCRTPRAADQRVCCGADEFSGGQVAYGALPVVRADVTAGQQKYRSRLQRPDGGTRLSAALMGAVPRRKENLVYIGLGTVVVIIVIVAVVMMLRRR